LEELVSLWTPRVNVGTFRHVYISHPETIYKKKTQQNPKKPQTHHKYFLCTANNPLWWTTELVGLSTQFLNT